MDRHRDAIATLYERHWQKLFIHAANLLGDEEEAKDAVNDVFCSALENHEKLSADSDLLPLFYVMVRNRCIDMIRHKDVELRNETNLPEELYGEWTEDDYRAYEEKIERMQASIARMAPQMRTVVEEYFLKEKKCADISRELHVSDNTVRTHIARAMKILRSQLNFFF